MSDPFDEHQAAWAAYTSSPWGRIRFRVVAEVLTRRLADLGPAPLRILDVGGGDGIDAAALAAAGHEVTVLDPSPEMLAGVRERAAAAGTAIETVLGGLDDLPRPGSWDVVLCHFVLQYRPAGAVPRDLEALASAVHDGGLVSVICPNPAGQVLARLVREGPQEALTELGRSTITAVTFDTEVRKVEAEPVIQALERAGTHLVGRYGGRIANDLLTDNDAKLRPDHYAALERLELALHDQEPFLRIGAYWHVVTRRG